MQYFNSTLAHQKFAELHIIYDIVFTWQRPQYVDPATEPSPAFWYHRAEKYMYFFSLVVDLADGVPSEFDPIFCLYSD